MQTQRTRNVPAHVPESLIYDFDFIADPLFSRDPQGGMDRLFAQAPRIFFTPANGGHWVVLGHEAIDEISRDHETFSNRRVDIPNSPTQPQRMIPTNISPPENTPYRHLLMRRLGPRAVRDLEPRIRGEARDRILAVKAAGACEFVSQIAAPIPAIVFMDLSGMPVERTDEFQHLARQIIEQTERAERDRLTKDVIAMLTELIEARRAQATGDLISDIAAADIDGSRMSLADMQAMCFLLFLAGLDTVVSGISLSIRHLAQAPDLQARLAERPADIPAFLEECLRRYGIAPNYRYVEKDVDYDGAPLRKGDMLMCFLPVAGLDPNVVDDPLAFDMDRQESRHLAFSIGPHSCIGQHLARLEMRIVLEEWLKLVPRFRLAAPDLPAEGHGSAVIGLNHLRLVWDA